LVDIINSIFEWVACITNFLNVIQIYKDKKTRGVYWKSWIFYFIWALWGMNYYFQVGHWFSFAGAIGVAVANFLWVIFAFIYRNK